MNKLNSNPFMRKPDHPNYNRRAHHHDYKRPAKYLITILKNPAIPAFSIIEGDSSIEYGSNAPHTIITRTGNFILQALQMWSDKFSQIKISEFVIMPDHIHLCLDVVDYLPNGLSLAISGLKGKISSLRHEALPQIYREKGFMPVFEKGFNDRIAYKGDQWEKQINYVRDNPRRYLIKKEFPDFMYRQWKLKINDVDYCAKGNILLLNEPSLFVVKHHRKWTEQESQDYQIKCRHKIDNGEIPVSPFIHPNEKELRNYAINNGTCYIRICENGFAERQSASGFEFDMMATGRILFIAPTEHNTREQEMKYDFAKSLNSLASELVESHEKDRLTLI